MISSNTVFDPMRYRKLRIAWSGLWGAAVLLIIVLWVRSYWWLDSLSGNSGREYVYLDTMTGRFHYSRSTNPSCVPVPWRVFHTPIVLDSLRSRQSESAGSHAFLGYRWKVWLNGWEISVAFWLPLLVSSVL